MTLNANKIDSGSKFNDDPLEAGSYPGRLVQMIDLGVQEQRPYNGKEKKPANEVMFTYEFSDEFLKNEDGEEIKDKPKWLSERMPIHSLKSDMAKSTKRYTALDPEGKYGGDFAALVDTPCNITVALNAKGDRVYENISAITAMRSKDAEKCPALVNPPKVFTLDDPDIEIFKSLPEWVQTVIKENMNYEGSKLQELLGDDTPTIDEDDKEEVDW
jgi:hypothetical protein